MPFGVLLRSTLQRWVVKIIDVNVQIFPAQELKAEINDFCD